jgi:hypothetical protein
VTTRQHPQLRELPDERLNELLVKGRRSVGVAFVFLVAGILLGLWVDWRLGVSVVLVVVPLLVVVSLGFVAALDESDRRLLR